MFTNLISWLILLGIPLLAYGVGRAFGVREVRYFHFALSTLLMVIPLVMLVFRVKTANCTPQLPSWGKIVIWASGPAGIVAFLAGYVILPISMSESFRTAVLQSLNDPWMICLEVLVFSSVVMLALALWLWDQSDWVPDPNQLVLNEEGRVLYPEQPIRYTFFHRILRTVSVSSEYRIEVGFPESGRLNRYLFRAYAKVDLKQALARRILRVDLTSFEEEVHRWGQKTLLSALPNWKIRDALDDGSMKILGNTDIQGVPVSLKLYEVTPTSNAGVWMTS